MKKFGNWLKKQNAGAITGIVFTLYSVCYLLKSFDYAYQTRFGMGPGFFPRWVAVLAIAAGIIYTIISLVKDKFIVEEVFPEKEELINVFSVVLAIGVWILIVNFTGFVIASTLLMFYIFRRAYPWHKALLFGLVTSIVVFAIFKLGFSVPVPVGILGF